jgi:Hemerythrin HHE cation binding domain
MSSYVSSRPETVRGRRLHGALLAVHEHLRSDLAAVERLAAAVTGGLPAADVHDELTALRASSTVWQFQVDCLRYCNVVHLHHRIEDAVFFAELREANPAIGPVVDRLMADHRSVSGLLGAVETAAQALSGSDGHGNREAVAQALGVLRERLLAHLDYEERAIAHTVRRLSEAPRAFG